MCILPLFINSVKKLGIKNKTLLRDAIQLAKEPLKKHLEDSSRKPRIFNSIKSMGFEESKDEDGFIYKRV